MAGANRVGGPPANSSHTPSADSGSRATAVIFGGAGFIGTHLAKRLVDIGNRVVVADLAKPRLQAAGVEFVSCDVREPIQPDIPPADVAFNLAAVHRTPGHSSDEYFETNVKGALNVTRWCSAQAVQSLVFTSSIAVYGPTERVRTEADSLAPTSAYGKSKAIAEDVHLAWQADDRERRLVMLRPSVIFGPGEGGNFTRLARALQGRRFVYPGRKDTLKSCGYVEDLIDAIEFVRRRSDRLNIINFGYPQPPTIEEICEAFCDIANYPRPRMLPGGVRTAAGLLRGTGLRPAMHLGERIRKLQLSTNIRPRVLSESGFQWRTDLRAALGAWYRSSPVGEFV